jgi:hypothetical protein
MVKKVSNPRLIRGGQKARLQAGVGHRTLLSHTARSES